MRGVDTCHRDTVPSPISVMTVFDRIRRAMSQMKTVLCWAQSTQRAQQQKCTPESRLVLVNILLWKALTWPLSIVHDLDWRQRPIAVAHTIEHHSDCCVHASAAHQEHEGVPREADG